MEFHEYRTHEDNRRRGAYNIVPGLPGDMNVSIHNPDYVPDELHMHKIQTDYFTVIKGKVLFRLAYDDGRPEEQFVLTDTDHKTLIVPPGVWHHYKALEESIMAFYITQQYNKEDEYRKKIDPASWNL